MSKIWSCKIGEVDESCIFPLKGADGPMRDAVSAVYRKLTGHTPNFIFSGWGAQLTELERAAVENRPPKVEPDPHEIIAKMRDIERMIRLTAQERPHDGSQHDEDLQGILVLCDHLRAALDGK